MKAGEGSRRFMGCGISFCCQLVNFQRLGEVDVTNIEETRHMYVCLTLEINLGFFFIFLKQDKQ